MAKRLVKCGGTKMGLADDCGQSVDYDASSAEQILAFIKTHNALGHNMMIP